MRSRLLLSAIALTLLLTSCAQAVAAPTPEAVRTSFASVPEPVYPGETWQWAETPEELGWSSGKLAVARAFSERLGSAAVMIVDDGIVVDAWGNITQNYICHSMRKSLMSGLYGIYVAEGKIDTSQTLGELGIDDYTPLTEAEKQATVADLLKARSGIYIPAVGESADMKASRPDLVLLDWSLPGTAADQLLPALRNAHPGLAVIVLSGQPEVRRAALAAGADAFVGKTDPPEQLLAAIRSVKRVEVEECTEKS